MQAGVEIGRDATVYCNDGPIGKVRQVVVDSAGGGVTDLVIEREDGARLVVPAGAVIHADGGTVTLAMSRGQLLGEKAATLRYRPEDYFPFGGQRGGNDATRREPGPSAPPPAGGQGRDDDAASPAPAPPDPRPRGGAITMDPTTLRPFEEGILRVPLRGEELVAEREAVVTGEVVVRKERRRETIEVRGTVRKERITVIERDRAGE